MTEQAAQEGERGRWKPQREAEQMPCRAMTENMAEGVLGGNQGFLSAWHRRGRGQTHARDGAVTWTKYQCEGDSWSRGPTWTSL